MHCARIIRKRQSACYQQLATSIRFSRRLPSGSSAQRPTDALYLLMMNAMKTLFLIALLVLGSTPLHAQTALPEIALSIKGHKLTAEVAANDNARMTGLMHRRMM